METDYRHLEGTNKTKHRKVIKRATMPATCQITAAGTYQYLMGLHQSVNTVVCVCVCVGHMAASVTRFNELCYEGLPWRISPWLLIYDSGGCNVSLSVGKHLHLTDDQDNSSRITSSALLFWKTTTEQVNCRNQTAGEDAAQVWLKTSLMLLFSFPTSLDWSVFMVFGHILQQANHRKLVLVIICCIK